MKLEKTQEDIIQEFQNNPDYVILSNSLSNPKFIKSIGKATFAQPLSDLYVPKIFVQIISKLTPQHLENRVGNYVKIHFNVTEFLDDVGVADKRGFYSHILDSIKTMQSINVQYEDKNTISGYSLIPAYEFGKNKGHLILDIHENIVREILEVNQNSNFSYLKQNLFKLSNSQAVKLFQFFVSWKNKGYVELTLDNFKKKFGYDTTGYSRFANLKLKVLDPAIKDINNKTTLDVEYEILSKNLNSKKMRVDGLRFTIKEKEKKYLESKHIIEETAIVIEEVKIEATDKDALFTKYARIVIDTFGVNPTAFFKIIDNHTDLDIKRAIEITQKTDDKKKMTNLAGFFVEALKNKYLDADEVKRTQERAKSAKIKQENEQDALEQKARDEAKRYKMIEEDEKILALVAKDVVFSQLVFEKFKESFIGKNFSQYSLAEVLNSNMTKAAFLSEAKKML
jgi:Initiator Replication protein